MNDEILPYYNQELAYLRKLGERFAKDHPKIAGRLRLGADRAEDPHVERLIESIAFLNGRIQHRLDDDFPEISDSMLGILYPHYLSPIPSFSIARFTADKDATASYRVERHAQLETERVGGEPCLFRTTFDTDVWPIEVERATLVPTPFDAPSVPAARTAIACLRIELKTLGGVQFSELDLDTLRVHLTGLPQVVYPLYEVLLNDVTAIAATPTPTSRTIKEMPADAIVPVGFGEDEGLLPYGPRSAKSYRLLTELFAFPQKFQFVDFTGLGPAAAEANETLVLHLFLKRVPRDLDQLVDASCFALGCTPIVNLFERRAEPIRLDHRSHEARVVPDARRPQAMEVHSIVRLTGVTAEGDTHELRPFYGLDHGVHGDAAPTFWHDVRRPAALSATKHDEGSEVYVQVVDLEFQPQTLEGQVLTPTVLCTNRDLPSKLPFGAGHPRLSLSDGGAVASIECLIAPTRTKRPPLRDGARWRLISHLSLNHLSLTEEGQAAESLRELLRLYEFVGSTENTKLIDAILDLKSQPTMARIHAGGQPGYCRGTAITVVLDENRFSGSGTFLFASVLERFFALYASVNSFVKVSLATNMREETVKTWAPRAGGKTLV